jgi:DNA-directed RNA polymerase specialized sigma24 family protein
MEEAAKVLKITVPAFKTRLFRARQMLKKEYVE